MQVGPEGFNAKPIGAGPYRMVEHQRGARIVMEAFDKYKDEHIAAYGPDNHLRLTGLHETQSIDKFNWGVANRGASVRVPHSFVKNNYKGYMEDRRPNSQANPYRIVARVLKTIQSVPTT